MEHAQGNDTCWHRSDRAYGTADVVIYAVTCTVVSISLPLNLVAIYAVYSLVQKDDVTPIFVINLLVSDLIQLCSMIVRVADPKNPIVCTLFFKMYFFSLMASVGFMVCVALERYLVLAWPLWYRFRRTVNISLMLCVMVWALPLVIIIADFYCGGPGVTEITFAVFVLLPYPLLNVFLCGTIKALSKAIGVPPEEKRRIVALLLLVLLIYTLLFLPTAIWCLTGMVTNALGYLCFVAVKFSPLADLFMYVFLRKGAVDNILPSLSCRRTDRPDICRSTA